MKAVVIIRPQSLQGQVGDLLIKSGFAPIFLPAATVVKLDYIDSESDIAIFVSQPSVQYGPSSLQTTTVFAIGPQTALSLERSHQSGVVLPTRFSTEGLLDHHLLQNIENQRINIYCGQHSKNKLFETLQSRGAHVEKKVVYALSAPSAVTLNKEYPSKGVIWVSSFELLKRFKTYYIEKRELSCFKNYDMITATSVSQEDIRALGFKGQVHWLNNPSQSAMIEGLKAIDW
jgi:uroporphyrinogen-III synthase